MRDRDTDGNGSLDERIYYCQNWRYDVVHGREVKNVHSLANPEALELYRDLPALQE